jgi:O-antigen ligase/tetratricopeptide (TPR) repeat protein
MSSLTTNETRAPSAGTVVGLLVLLPIAMLAFGSVHVPSRAGLALLVAFFGGMLARRGRFEQHKGLMCALAAALLVSALPLLPVGPELRSFFLGDLAAPVQAVHDLVGGVKRPLALDPFGAVLGLAEVLALLLMGLGVASWATRVGRVRQLVWACLGTGVLLVVLMLIHRMFNIDSIYGSGIPGPVPEQFFGPFINANHGGALCAALVPLAFVRAQDGVVRDRSIGWLVLGCLVFGVWASGSRGAVVGASLGLSVSLFVAGSRNVRIIVGCMLGFLLVAVLAIGPAHALKLLSDLVAPGVSVSVEHGYTDLTTGRSLLLGDAIQIAKQVLWLGVGAGGFNEAYKIVRTDPSFNISSHAHNEPIQLLVEHGLIGFLLVMVSLAMIIAVGIKALQTWSDRPDRRWMIAGFIGCLTALGTVAMVDFPFRLGSHSVLAVLAMGAIVGLSRPQRGGRSLSKTARAGVSLAMVAVLVLVVAVVNGNGGIWGSGKQSRLDGQAWFVAVEKGAERGLGLDAAAKHFENAAGRDMDRASFQWLARVRVGQGRYDDADAVLAAGLGVYPTMPWLWRDRARLAQRTGDSELARESWARMIALDLPSLVNPIDVLHEAFFGGEFDSPIEQARAILPERPDRYRQAARVMDELGLKEESEALFRHAIAQEPEGVFYYAEALVRWGRPADAALILEKHHAGCASETLYAGALLDIGQAERAAQVFSEALSHCGTRSWKLRSGLTHARLLAGDPRGSETIDRLLDERPDAHALRRVWIRILSRKGRPGVAVPHLEHLRWAGVMRADEALALERASVGLPFRLVPTGSSTE